MFGKRCQQMEHQPGGVGVVGGDELDTAAHGIGQLASAATGAGYSRVYTYDTLSRPSTVTITVDTRASAYHTVYSDGRISTVDYSHQMLGSKDPVADVQRPSAASGP